MTSLAPVWRERAFFGLGGLVALFVGYHVAQGSFLIPGLVALGASAAVASLLRTTTFQALIVGGLVIGYIVGNRGFAQFMPVPGVPLLPAEIGLVLLAGLQVLERASAGPERRWVTIIDGVILTWIVIGSVRFLFDVRGHGLVAVRDFAMVYYAAFFFLAQTLIRNRPTLTVSLLATVRVAAVVMLVLNRLAGLFPSFFFDVLAVRGTPLIFYKTDLVGMFLAAGAVLQYLRYEQKGGWWRLPLIALMAYEVLNTDNRAAMLGMVMGFFWLMAGGRWRLTGMVSAALVLVVIGTLWVARQTNTPWQDTPLLGMYEKVVSVIDPSGQRHYRGTDTFNKGDNNRYRLVWWSLVARETWEGNPAVGLGFGHDLAGEFIQTYYGNLGEDYAVRSPHSIVMTIFARMGVVGLLPFLVLIGLMAAKTWRSLRPEPDASTGFWLISWVIFVTACFGVVLEGPMGAVVFWLMLGTANGLGSLESEGEDASDDEAIAQEPVDSTLKPEFPRSALAQPPSDSAG